MKERRVRFTATAQRHIARERIWWLGNRDYPDLFATELEGATQILALLPERVPRTLSLTCPAFVVCTSRNSDVTPIYTFDDNEVIVRAFWGARRDRGPSLR